MKAELTKFKVREGKSALVDEWMDMLRQNLPAVLSTLEGERIYVESIFRESADDGQYLYWYSLSGEGGVPVEQSSHEIDKKHLEYWRECIEADYRVEFGEEVTLLSARVQVEE